VAPGSRLDRTGNVIGQTLERVQTFQMVEINLNLEFLFDHVHKRDRRDRIPSSYALLRCTWYFALGKIFKNGLKTLDKPLLNLIHVMAGLLPPPDDTESGNFSQRPFLKACRPDWVQR